MGDGSPHQQSARYQHEPHVRPSCHVYLPFNRRPHDKKIVASAGARHEIKFQEQVVLSTKRDGAEYEAGSAEWHQ